MIYQPTRDDYSKGGRYRALTFEAPLSLTLDTAMDIFEQYANDDWRVCSTAIVQNAFVVFLEKR